MSEQVMLTTNEIAAQLSISRRTIDRLVRDGKIPVIKTKRGRRFPADEVREWVTECKA